MSSLIIKVSRNGQSQEYLFSSLGPIVIGANEKCDLHLPDVEGRLLEVKISGGNIFIKDLGQTQMYLNSRILPHREEVRYHSGEAITIQNSQYQLSIAQSENDQADPPPFFENEFRERLEKMQFKIKEKESELKSLIHQEGKRRHDLDEILKSFRSESQEKGKLSAEVEGLRTRKEQLADEIKDQHQKSQDEEEISSKGKTFDELIKEFKNI